MVGGGACGVVVPLGGGAKDLGGGDVIVGVVVGIFAGYAGVVERRRGELDTPGFELSVYEGGIKAGGAVCVG